MLEVKEFHCTGKCLFRNYLSYIKDKGYIFNLNKVQFLIPLPSPVEEGQKTTEHSPHFEYLYTPLVLPQYGQHRLSISAASLKKLMDAPEKEIIPLI